MAADGIWFADLSAQRYKQMKLVMCAGDRRLDGFEHHDVRPLNGLNYVCDFYDIDKHAKNGSYEEVQLTHALEHFPTKETQKVLHVLRSLLCDGGKLYIEVPNFAWHASLVASGRDRDAVYYAFGGQLDEYDFHKTGFTQKILEEELAKAGFKNIQTENSSSLTTTCYK